MVRRRGSGNLGHVKRAARPFRAFGATELNFWLGSLRSATAFSIFPPILHVHVHVNGVRFMADDRAVGHNPLFSSHWLSLQQLTFLVFSGLPKVPEGTRHPPCNLQQSVVDRKEAGPAPDKLSILTSDL
jgi:hypothetical protein